MKDYALLIIASIITAWLYLRVMDRGALVREITATESEIRCEGILAILLKAGIDPNRARRVKEGYTREGERYWIWADGNKEDRDHHGQR